MDEGKIAVYISKELCDKVKSRIKERNIKINSTENYVEFVLREFLKVEDEEETFSKEEEELIKKRLSRLGYL